MTNVIPYTKERSLKAAVAELIEDHVNLKREVDDLREHNRYLESRVSEESDYATLRAENERLKGEVERLRETIASDDAPRLRGLLTVLDMYANHQHLCSKKCTCGLTRTRADIERLLKSDTPKVKKG